MLIYCFSTSWLLVNIFLPIALIPLTWLKEMRFVFELLLDFGIFVVVVAQQTVNIKVDVAAPEPAVYRTVDAKGIVRTNNINMTSKG